MPEAGSLVQMPQTAVVVSNEWEKQLDLIRNTVAPGLKREDFELFLHVCRVRHLDPLQRQVHAVMRKTWNKALNDGKGGYEERMTIQTGIDGYRAIANRTGLYMPSDKEARVEEPGKEDLRVTMYVKKYHPLSGSWHEFSATAYFREFVQTFKSGDKQVANSMWEKMPINQLTKCAEALALRKGWPEELGGIYSDDEMQHADSVTMLPPDNTPQGAQQQNKIQRDMGKMKPSSEPNRGHGNEGTQRQPDKEMCAECRAVNGHTDECKNNPKNKQQTIGGKKPSPREQWQKREGHDPKVHISFDDALQLFEIEKNLKISQEDMAAFLDREFEVQHRHLIRQDQFQQVLDEVNKQYNPQPAKAPLGENDGLFDK